jgi:hypothetical protein
MMTVDMYRYSSETCRGRYWGSVSMLWGTYTGLYTLIKSHLDKNNIKNNSTEYRQLQRIESCLLNASYTEIYTDRMYRTIQWNHKTSISLAVCCLSCLLWTNPISNSFSKIQLADKLLLIPCSLPTGVLPSFWTICFRLWSCNYVYRPNQTCPQLQCTVKCVVKRLFWVLINVDNVFIGCAMFMFVVSMYL